MKKHLLGVVMMAAIAFYCIVIQPNCKEENPITENPIKDIRWILESIQYSSQNIINAQDTFWILLKEDFTMEMQVDCNVCTGSYQIGDNQFLVFATPTCTEVFCGPDSLDQEFLEALDDVSRYEREGNQLRLYFNDEQSRLNFNAQ